MKSTLLCLSLCLFTVGLAPAQDKKPETPAAKDATGGSFNDKEEAPEAPAKAELPVVDPTNVDQLRANEQKMVIVRGKVSRTKDWDGNGKPDKGINFVNIGGDRFTMVTFASDYDKFGTTRPAAMYRDKTIEVTGKLEERQGRWQIKVSSPDQVKIVGDEEKKEGDAKDEKKAKK